MPNSYYQLGGLLLLFVGVIVYNGSLGAWDCFTIGCCCYPSTSNKAGADGAITGDSLFNVPKHPSEKSIGHDTNSAALSILMSGEEVKMPDIEHGP